MGVERTEALILFFQHSLLMSTQKKEASCEVLGELAKQTLQKNIQQLS